MEDQKRILSPEEQAKVDALLEIAAISKSGYGGVLPNGNIVDRRNHPEATPIAKNSMFGVPEPIKIVKLNCMVCEKEFWGKEPTMCCSGRECGCMGMPTEPVVCSEECYDKRFNKQKKA